MGLLPCKPEKQSKGFIHRGRILEDFGDITIEQNDISPLSVCVMMLATGGLGEIIFRLKVFGWLRLVWIHIGVFRAGSLLGH